ncbi:MAG: DUF1902 domain-containing protein [Caulobacteraceae bacterium]
MAKQYHVEARWDAEAGAFYAKNNIPGLNVEAETIADFIDIVKDLAPDLIKANDPTADRQTPTVRLEADILLA